MGSSGGERWAQAAGAPAPAAIHTDTDGLDAGLVKLRSGVPVYAALPKGGSELPIVLIAAEIFGLHEHIRDIVRRFAKLGCLAAAPDYFYRYGDPLQALDIESIRDIVAKTPDSETMSIFDDVLAAAGRHGGDTSRAGIVGFCWGGRIAWLYAAHNPHLLACAPFYGRLDGPRTTQQPAWPIDIAPALHVPTLGFYGGADPSIPVDLVQDMQKRLAFSGAPAEILLYDDAPHAFFADYRESYRAADAKDAWGRAVAFFRAQGVG